MQWVSHTDFMSKNLPYFFSVDFLQVQLAEAVLRSPGGPVASVSAQCWLQLHPGGLCHPGGAFSVFGAADRHQTPTM